MKKRFYFYLLLVILGVITYFSYEHYFAKKQCCDTNPNTELCVVNSTTDTVNVFLTLGSDTNYVTNVNGIYGITTSGLKGSFSLAPNDTVSYQSPCGKGFNGNIAFGDYANNCPDTTVYPNGMNIFEFALNNNFNGIPNAQETIDISCVSGVNCKITCNLSANNWNAGDTLGFTSFGNSFLYDNVYRVGVFPYGCDSCTVIKAPPVCPNHKKYSQPQKKNICNVQRNSTLKGGQIYVVYGGVLKGEITEEVIKCTSN
jgi:hypothetical protein